MPRKRKIDVVRDNVIKDYRTGNFTRIELSGIYRLSKKSIDTILYGINKPFKYDVLDNHPYSLDQMKARGREPGSSEYDPYVMIDKQEYTKIVTCPECPMKFTAHNLLIHLVKVHKRFDLEYLL